MIRDVESKGYTARWARYVTADKYEVGVLVLFKAVSPIRLVPDVGFMDSESDKKSGWRSAQF